jgi:hypothetical protein
LIVVSFVLRRAESVSHPRAPDAHRLRRSRDGVARRLVLHLGIYFRPQRMTIAEIQCQVMKPIAAPSEP